MKKDWLMLYPSSAVNNLQLYTSEICNLKCPYCALLHDFSGVNIDYTLKILNLLLKNIFIPDIYVVGKGEPILQMENLEKVLDLIKTLSPNTNLTVHSNGTIPDRIYYLLEKYPNLIIICNNSDSLKTTENIKSKYNNPRVIEHLFITINSDIEKFLANGYKDFTLVLDNDYSDVSKSKLCQFIRKDVRRFHYIDLPLSYFYKCCNDNLLKITNDCKTGKQFEKRYNGDYSDWFEYIMSKKHLDFLYNECQECGTQVKSQWTLPFIRAIFNGSDYGQELQNAYDDLENINNAIIWNEEYTEEELKKIPLKISCDIREKVIDIGVLKEKEFDVRYQHKIYLPGIQDFYNVARNEVTLEQFIMHHDKKQYYNVIVWQDKYFDIVIMGIAEDICKYLFENNKYRMYIKARENILKFALEKYK